MNHVLTRKADCFFIGRHPNTGKLVVLVSDSDHALRYELTDQEVLDLKNAIAGVEPGRSAPPPKR